MTTKFRSHKSTIMTKITDRSLHFLLIDYKEKFETVGINLF